MINVNFTPLTNPIVWFATMADFNAFMESLTVSITSTDLPVATINDAGAVKIAAIPTFSPTALSLSYVEIVTDPLGDGNYTVTNVLDQVSALDLLAKVVALENQLNALQAAMVSAGSGVLT